MDEFKGDARSAEIAEAAGCAAEHRVDDDFSGREFNTGLVVVGDDDGDADAVQVFDFLAGGNAAIHRDPQRGLWTRGEATRDRYLREAVSFRSAVGQEGPCICAEPHEGLREN